MSWQTSDLERRVASGLRIGTITAVDATNAVARVSLGGETESDWLPWLAERAGTISAWAPVSVGEQVLVASISGDTAQGIIVGSLFSSANPAPASAEGERRIQLGAASVVMTDAELRLSVGGTSIAISDGQVTVTSDDTTVTGATTVQGLFTYTAGMAGQGGAGATARIDGSLEVTGGDVSADGISLKTHTHPGDSGGNTGAPQ